MQRPIVSAGGVSEDRDLAAWVAAARGGDRTAFGRLYERYAPMVHGILLARIPAGEVSDLVQDVFVQAMRQVHTLREVACFGGWLATVTRNRANDYHRHVVEHLELTPETQAGGAVQGAASAPRDEDAAAILAMVCNLPEAYRETLILRLVEGYTGPEIAERTGLTPGSVRVNLHRGMHMLREKLRLRSRK
jgi:RNA polymerase sigma-70 factor (ECF subfamily)